MNNINYDSFYIFCVSLGVVLIATPIILLFLLNINNLPIVNIQDYELLTDESKYLIDKTLKLYNCFTDLYVFLLIVSIAIGLLVFVYGMHEWSKKQKTIIDKLDEGEIIKQGLAIKEMSKDDIKKKIENEDKGIKQNTKSEFNKINNFETDFYNNLLLNTKKTYLKDVKISNCVYDVIEISNSYTNDVIYEIKHWYDTPNSDNLSKVNNDLLKMKVDYLNLRKRKVDIVLVINSLSNEIFDYSKIKECLSEVNRIIVYGNDVNNILADILLR